MFSLTTLFFSPAAGLCGLIAVSMATVWGRLLSMHGQSQLLNSILLGLLLGAYHGFHLSVILWLLVGTLNITLVATWLTSVAWHNGQLPILSVPFALTSWIVLLATQASKSVTMPVAAFSPDGSPLLFPFADNFFTSLGWLFLTPYPLAGAILFIGMLITSRYMAFLALLGYLVGDWTLAVFNRHDTIIVGYNFILVAVALGGFFAAPGLASFAMAMAGVVCAALFSITLGYFAYPIHLPVLTLPSILALYLWLGSMRMRDPDANTRLIMPHPPGLPERAYEKLRIARRRVGSEASVPLSPPFYGEWRVSQGFDGPHTHQPPWQHALDFEIVEGEHNHRESGNTKQHYYCFGAPVLAPAAGQIIAMRHDLPDLEPGKADVLNNWGNFLTMRIADGNHVLLAHLKQDSIVVRHGEWVSAGQTLAACGSSGRSLVPHLHLHLQNRANPGEATCPFHLINVLLRRYDRRRAFRLYHLPGNGDEISHAPADPGIFQALHHPPGTKLLYRLTLDDKTLQPEASLTFILSLLGQSRVTGNSGSSAAFEETLSAIGHFDRQGKEDKLLDIWLLCLGLTPYSAAAENWDDHPPFAWMPSPLWLRLLLLCLYPLGGGINSSYRRRWDQTQWAWIQEGEHNLPLLPFFRRPILLKASTEALIDPQRGIRSLCLCVSDKVYKAELLWPNEVK